VSGGQARRRRQRRRQQAAADGCTGKARYASYDEAGLALVEAKIGAALRANRRRREQRIYWCGSCNGFHLTSRSEQRPARGAAS
jgi:hypothetical protein